MTKSIETRIDGNPGAAMHPGSDEWHPGVGEISLERFIFADESATDAQLEIVHDDLDGRKSAVSVELTYADLLALRATLDEIIADVVEDGREASGIDEAFTLARAAVTLDTPCTGCGKPMPDEFYDVPVRFDGVLNDRLQPFHHGCEDF